MVTAQQVHLEATAALLERAYGLALGIEEAGDRAAGDARELVSVLDEARVQLLVLANVQKN
ncbi:MAG: hypothetical protein IBJ14_06720 [Hydrogenophaga sp.]|nr:hypothetical protein [Hydrogenophaga sp.]